ncbi:sensor histidine kinase [Paenibacillus sp. PAMC21692]|uniref:sensor histidine kinase n=1 Tax=Paenibacillus sp. PAMC21692 TaxID=2762320 RepID=UPI00164E8E49|nr:histidine kinase [Paenibacillus sp. PAMC21692]QNK59024.1 histidine kinase [Paenibacillus sp. PAMC21692]
MKLLGIQSRLFVSYISLILVIALILGGVFYLFVSSYIQNKVLSTYKQLVTSASSQYDIVVSDMDVLAKDTIVSRIPYADEMNLPPLANPILYLNDFFFLDRTVAEGIAFENPELGKTELITGIINAVNGLNYRATEVLLYDMNDIMYSAPFNIAEEMIRERRDLLASAPWFRELISEYGNTHLLGPYRTNWYGSKPGHVFSWFRTFRFTSDPERRGVIEIQQDYEKIVKIVESSFGSYANRVHIYGSEGELVYPVEAAVSERLHPERLASYAPQADRAFLTERNESEDSGRQALIAMRSGYTGWTIALSMDYEVLYAELYAFRNNIATVSALMLIFAFLLSYFVSKSITRPLKLLHGAVRKRGRGLNLNPLTEKQEKKIASSAEEISQVYSAFKDTYSRLEESMNDTIEARTREAEAYMAALQAQINPHFLHNTLAVIAAASEEGDIEKTARMCYQLSDMLYYASTQSETMSTLQHELDYSMDYLSLMKMRFEEKLIYDIDIPETLLSMPLPKLVLQPLIENCFNHGFKLSKPPWTVRISAFESNAGWEISVADNGIGIEDGKLASIYSRLIPASSPQDGRIADPAAGGIGLIGSIRRLTLLNKAGFSFELGRNEAGGFTVRLKFLKQ